MSHLPPEPSPAFSDEELLLLRSAKDDRPSPEALAATLAAVGTGVAVASSAVAAQTAVAAAGKGAGTTATWMGSVATAKWVSVVAIAAAVTAGGVALEQYASQREQARPRIQARHVPAHSLATQLAREQSAALPSMPPTTVTPPLPPPSIAPSQPKRAIEPRRVETTALALSQPDLTREIASLDAARAALRRGAAVDALRALAQYEAEYGHTGSLKIEATAVRIEALFSHGDRPRARSLARTFLSRHPQSPYAAAIRKLVASDQAEPAR